MIGADFQQGIESVSQLKAAHLCSNNDNMTLSCGILFSVTELIWN